VDEADRWRDDALSSVGGLEGLYRIIEDFYGRVFSDAMIGFMFRGADRQRLVAKEVELTAAMLGATSVRYTGRSMGEVHRAHRIMGGQFARRMQIMRETLADHAVDARVAARWLEHNERLRPAVTDMPSDGCR
jgi:truncated hemoglobin YjbI